MTDKEYTNMVVGIDTACGMHIGDELAKAEIKDRLFNGERIDGEMQIVHNTMGISIILRSKGILKECFIPYGQIFKAVFAKLQE